jgi:hypothetical protein
LGVIADMQRTEASREHFRGRQRMPAAARGHGPRKVGVQIGKARAGDMRREKRRSAGLRAAQVETAVQDRKLWGAKQPLQGIDID